MNSYNINKGIGRTVEFKGLKAQYLFIFAGGLLGTLILVMILYMAGVNSYICLFIGAGCFAHRMADLFTEPKVRRTRADESGCKKTASSIHHLPQACTQVFKIHF